jgi:tetratricopeptide (TPR) repeat protein
VRRNFARGVLLSFLGSALFLTLRLALSEAAIRRDPEQSLQASGLFRSALNTARYDSSADDLRAALRDDPRLSLAWIRLGLLAEQEKNLTEAEADLLDAGRVDRQYLPAWTLANFYFRRGDMERFWPWAQRAAALTFDDYRPLLRLADDLESSPRLVASRLGGGAPLLRAYLDLLIGAGRLEAAQEIALLLAARNDPSDGARLADLAARRMRAGETPTP